ncbi:MAG: glycogen debranching N-terminal domain-containing protein, partial [Chitinispirillaceae bacterium]
MNKAFYSPDSQVMPESLLLWRGPSLLVLGNDGGIHRKGFEGFYFRGVRYLSELRFDLNGHPPRFCSASRTDFNRLEFFFIYPPVSGGGTGGSGSGMIHKREGIAERGIDIRMELAVHPAALDLELTLTNRWDEEISLEVRLQTGCDFLSLDESHNKKTEVDIPVDFHKTEKGVIYESLHPKLKYRTEVKVSDGSWTISDEGAVCPISIRRGEKVLRKIHVSSIDPDLAVEEHKWAKRVQKSINWNRSLCRVYSETNQEFADLINGSMDYLCSAAMLEGKTDEWLAPAAGYPLYPYLFGRDALTSGWMMAMFDGGQSAKQTINRLGRLQGENFDSFRDEQPGRIIQQARYDSSSRLELNPFGRYYGDYASPFMYIITLAHVYAWTGEAEFIKNHWERCRRILHWAQRNGDIDGDGFLEYRTQSRQGPRHQGWKDSENAVVDENGKLVDPPIATCELQGYYYAALQAAALFSYLNREFRQAVSYARKSIRLKRRFNENFWIDDERYFAFGLDSRKNQIRSRTSNVGHCLASGIIDEKRVLDVVGTLFAPDMFSGWGVRTLSSTNPSYNPLSYHLGSVWPVENATIAFGLRRYGYDEEALRLVGTIFELSRQWKNGFIPECIGGYDRRESGHPGAFPRANPYQSWNEASFGLFTHVLLGLQPAAPIKTLFLCPRLPCWLPDLRVEGLRIGGAMVSFHCRRKSNGKTVTKILKKSGHVRVLFQQPVNSFHTSVWKRILDLAGGSCG